MGNNLQKIIKNITYTIYDINDFINNSEITSVVDSLNSAIEYFNNYDFSKKYDLDTISDYFLVKKICNYKKFLQFITPEYKEKVESAIDFYGDISKRYEDNKIAEFYNNYDFKITNKQYDLKNVIYADLPHRLKDLNKETYIRAFNASKYSILNNYSLYKNVLLRYKELYHILFSNDMLQVLIHDLNDRFIEIAEEICKDKNFFDQALKDRIVKQFVDLANVIIKNTDKKNALRYQIWYKRILNFFESISYPEYEKYLTAKQSVDEMSDKCIKEDGYECPLDIPIKEIREYLNDTKKNIVHKQIFLTHSKYKKQLAHYCISSMAKNKLGIIDYFSSPQERNKHFTLSIIQAISIAHQFYGVAFQIYLNDEKHRKDFFGTMNSFIQYIYDALNISVKSIESRVTLLENKIDKYVSLLGGKEITLEEKEHAQDCGEKTVQFIEVFLREIYVAIKRERKEFCNPNKLTLGALIDYHDAKNAFKGILPDQFMQYLNYVLQTDIDSDKQRVGLNIRNNVIHANKPVEDYNIGDTFLAIMVLTGIINSLFLYYNEVVVKRNNEENKKRQKIESFRKKQSDKAYLLQNKQSELLALKNELSEINKTMLDNIVYPEELKEFAESNVDISSENIELDKVHKLREFLIKYVNEKLVNTEEYKKYKELFFKCDQKEYEFCTEVLNFYREIIADRKKIFSKDYFNAIDELSQDGLFFYYLRTPDIPESLMLENDKEKRNSNLLELFVMRIRNMYSTIIQNNDDEGKNIKEAIEYLENEDYDLAMNKEMNFIGPQIEILRKNISKNIFKGKNLNYYNTVSKKILTYWDQVIVPSLLAYDVGGKYSNKYECAKLLVLYNNVREINSAISCINYINRIEDIKKQ